MSEYGSIPPNPIGRPEPGTDPGRDGGSEGRDPEEPAGQDGLDAGGAAGVRVEDDDGVATGAVATEGDNTGNDGTGNDGTGNDGAGSDASESGGAEGGDRGDPGTAEFDDPARLAAAVEAVLFVVDTPVTSADLAGVLGVPGSTIDQALSGLRDGYDLRGHGFALREVAEGWRLYTREEYAPYVERYLLDGQQARLTQAALETLAVVAYRQPVTRSRIAAIRGVGVDGVMRTLLTRGLVEECGTDPGTGGNLYRTTSLFLERLGLRSLDELPSLAPLLPEIDALDDVATSA